MEDVARVAGVTPMTVSRAFGQPDLVSAKTRQKIFDAADNLNFVLNRSAGALRSKTAKMVGLLIPSLSDATYHGIFTGLVEVMDRIGFQVLVAETCYSNERELSTLRQMLGWHPAALVLTGTHHTQATLDLLRLSNALVCCVMQVAHSKFFSSIGFSNFEAMGLLTQHLIESGRRRIVFVRAAGAEYQRLSQRLAAIQQVVESTPNATFRILDLKRSAPLDIRDGAQAVEEALALVPAADALMFSNDLPAAGAVLHCRRLGIEVPGRLAITGFGDLGIATMVDPSLTTVQIPMREMGVRAGEYLCAAIEAGRSTVKHQDLGFKIQLRGSTPSRSGKKHSHEDR
ncbi:LacI family DNA-binding transcriptional regulator [Bradyrhizobium guangzhouense]|uniref:LacI family DNA-binding transcriptional regulator n=1 Tax=Bradyrhizobium guangzhouense TaxID=1325095 RepID=UPI0013E8DE6B|nr:LacI family DNA-binding transcriptional regulator [Bradyrhizobium guangzhouense]